eukprot:1188078-Prorocentrum_minimum.AAC.1
MPVAFWSLSRGTKLAIFQEIPKKLQAISKICVEFTTSYKGSSEPRTALSKAANNSQHVVIDDRGPNWERTLAAASSVPNGKEKKSPFSPPLHFVAISFVLSKSVPRTRPSRNQFAHLDAPLEINIVSTQKGTPGHREALRFCLGGAVGLSYALCSTGDSLRAAEALPGETATLPGETATVTDTWSSVSAGLKGSTLVYSCTDSVSAISMSCMISAGRLAGPSPREGMNLWLVFVKGVRATPPPEPAQTTTLFGQYTIIDDHLPP